MTDFATLLSKARALEGCPAGRDDHLLALADPPHYTPFPNPFVGQFLLSPGAGDADPLDGYAREPLAADISEGRHDPVYLAQNYHTKVPYRAVARYLEHFTRPGDLVLDGFCGSGMVGVAANQTGRRAILCDLSPAATFIAHSYCHPVDLDEARAAVDELLARLDKECGWLYREHTATGRGPSLAYVIWSEVVRCPACGAEFPFAEVAFDFERRRPAPGATCPACGCSLKPSRLERVPDGHGLAKEVPVRAAYTGSRRKREFVPGPSISRLHTEIEELTIPYWHPDNSMMNREEPDGGWGDMWRRGYHTGMQRVPDFYFKRSLWTLACAVDLVRRSMASRAVRQLLLQVIVNASTSFTRMRRAYQAVLPLVMYVPRLRREVNVVSALGTRFDAILACLSHLRTSHDVLITTQSSTSLANVPDSCVDYVFTDPPFGDNIRYSEMNFLWESWLRVFTNQPPEAVISPGQGKGIAEYQELMRRCFAEMRRALKPDRWITVAFHNSGSRVWNAIQEALQDAGFQVESVRLLDKRQISFKQASAGTVRHDLVISARKAPVQRAHSAGFVARAPDPPSAETAWEFVRARLASLPVPRPAESGSAVERTANELFNRMVAEHVREGAAVPVDASEFSAGLRARFEERDGIFLLPAQAAEYDRLVAASG